MSKLGRKIKNERPERYYEVAELTLSGKMSEDEAARICGFSKQWYRTLIKRDFPDRKKVHMNPSHMAEVGKKNRKWTTYMEKTFSDGVLCYMMKATSFCNTLCPLYDKCHGESENEGLVSGMLKKVPYKPLKPAQNTLEDKE